MVNVRMGSMAELDRLRSDIGSLRSSITTLRKLGLNEIAATLEIAVEDMAEGIWQFRIPGPDGGVAYVTVEIDSTAIPENIREGWQPPCL